MSKRYNTTTMVVSHMSFWLLCVAAVVALAMLGCDKAPIKSSRVVLKGVDIYFADTTLVEDITVERDKREMAIKGERIRYDDALDEIIDGMVAAQKKGGSQPYIFIGLGGSKTDKMFEVIKIGHHPKGEEPFNL